MDKVDEMRMEKMSETNEGREWKMIKVVGGVD